MSEQSVIGILQEIKAERKRQDLKWGGPENDDKKSPQDWHRIIADYNSWARNMGMMNSPDKRRKRLIQIAALCVAAIESNGRAPHLYP